MPRLVSFEPRLLRGTPPGAPAHVEWTPAVIRRQKPWVREGRRYDVLDFYYNKQLDKELSLRQHDSAVYVATDAYIQRSDSLWADSAWQKHPYTEARLAEITRQDASGAQSARQLRTALGQYESPLFKFNAKENEEWLVYRSIRSGWIASVRVKLLKISLDSERQPLYRYSVIFSPGASHLPALLELVVSPRRGIVGMQWYEYVCWGSPGNCHDWILQYGTALE